MKSPPSARTEMYIRQAGPGSYRQVLREVRHKEIYKLIVDTDPAHMQQFFRAVSRDDKLSRWLIRGYHVRFFLYIYMYIYLSTSVCLFSTGIYILQYLQQLQTNPPSIHRTSQEFYYNQITIFNPFALDSSKISKFHENRFEIPLNRSVDIRAKDRTKQVAEDLKSPKFHE